MSCIITYKGNQYSEEKFKEYFINNKNEFATSISKNKDVIDSFKRKIEAIDGVFKDSPELANIGTKAQYMQYLSTIFKTSKVKDVVYHGTKDKNSLLTSGKFEIRTSKEFNYSHGSIFATSNIQDAETAGTGRNIKYDVVAILINLKNPGISKEGKIDKKDIDNLPFNSKNELEKVIRENKENWKDIGWEYEVLPNNVLKLKKSRSFKNHGIWNKNNNLILDLSYNAGFIGQITEKDINILKDSNLDGIIADDTYDSFGKQKVGNKTWYVVFEPEQIHILGSKQDIENFVKFVNNSNVGNVEVMQNYMKSKSLDYIMNKLIDSGKIEKKC